MKPAHLSGTAGQIVNAVGDTEDMLYRRHKSVQTLGDYIKQAQKAEEPSSKVIFFEEWAVKMGLAYFINGKVFQWTSIYQNEAVIRDVWRTAQENV